VVDIVTQYRLGIVEELSCCFIILAVIDDFLQEVGVVPAGGLD